MNLVALKLFADAVRPREQVKNVGGSFEVNEPRRLVAGDFAAVQDALAEDGQFVVVA